ncbi:hypothetical protein EDC96DRAFT_529764 [Choanephora cucurbitarum]|nr:hypothetical protein EDC96DRAFT_529764 [Choanephora cucurbitarum]
MITTQALCLLHLLLSPLTTLLPEMSIILVRLWTIVLMMFVTMTIYLWLLLLVLVLPVQVWELSVPLLSRTERPIYLLTM